MEMEDGWQRPGEEGETGVCLQKDTGRAPGGDGTVPCPACGDGHRHLHM